MVGFFAAQRRLCLTAACLCICLYFAPPVLALLWAAETVFHAVAVLVFAGALIAFWCFGVGVPRWGRGGVRTACRSNTAGSQRFSFADIHSFAVRPNKPSLNEVISNEQ